MEKHKWYWILIMVSLAILISSTAGCIKVTREGQGTPPTTKPPATAPASAMPVINSFTSNPQTINAGQSATLSWKASGVTTVTIQPQVGQVGPSGSKQVSPATTTTYTLTATNQAGGTTRSATVTVTAAATSKPEAGTGKPDLVITDIWLEAQTVYYKIKNQSAAEAKASRSYLYLNNLQQASSYVDVLAPGQEKTDSFSNWQLPSPSPGGTAPVGEIETSLILKVCADAENTADESIENNNCLRKIMGQTFTYDFVKNAHLASWRSGAGDFKWPMVSSDKKGAAFLLFDALVMCPEYVSQGWIQGRFADYYTPYLGAQSTSREIVIPEMAKFTSKVGFEQGAKSTDGARVALGYVDATGSVVLFQKMDISSDGTSRLYEVDLSDLAGKKTEFILWVEAKDSPEEDCIRWEGPKITQE